MVEEVSDEAEVRQRSSSSLISAAASFRRPALIVLALGAAAVIVVLARHTPANRFLDEVSSRRLYRFISCRLVLLAGWVAFIVLARPLRRRRGR